MYRMLGVRSRYRCRGGKEIIVKNCVRLFLSLSIQQAKRIRSIILSSVVCPALPYFSILSYKRYDFQRGGITKRTGVLISSYPRPGRKQANVSVRIA